MSKRIGYIRVSTADQNSIRQLDGVELDKVFEDKCSGSNTNRPALQRMKEFVREDDIVIVHDISRLARNIEDLIQLIKYFNELGATVEFKKESLIFTADDSNPMNNLMLTMLGAVYQFEREMLLERQREGIAKAKEAGKYKGGKKQVDRDEVKRCIDDGMSVRKTAEHLGIAPATVQRIKKELA